MSKIQKQYADIRLVKAIINHDNTYIDSYFISELKDYQSPHAPHDPLIVIAVESNNQEIINKLLLANVNLTQKNYFNWSLFHSLTLYNIPNKQKWMSSFIPQKISYPCHAIEAAVTGMLEYFKEYLNNNQTHHLTQKEPLTQLQPIHYAAANGHIDIVRLLLKMKPSLAYAKCARGNTPAHFAALNDHIDIVKEIIEIHEINIYNLCNKNNDTLLYHAAYGKAYKTLYYLSKKYPDLLMKILPDILFYSLNVNPELLTWIGTNYKSSELKKLINETKISDLPLLHYAIYYINIDACIWLIAHGADLLSYNKHGKNALDIASEQQRNDLFDYMCMYQQIKNKFVACVNKNVCINQFKKDYDTSFIKPEFVSLKELAAGKLIHVEDKMNLNVDCKNYFSKLKISNMSFHNELQKTKLNSSVDCNNKYRLRFK